MFYFDVLQVMVYKSERLRNQFGKPDNCFKFCMWGYVPLGYNCVLPTPDDNAHPVDPMPMDKEPGDY